MAIISAAGEMTWRYGAPDTGHQHHATWQANGNVQIFDGEIAWGMHRGVGWERCTGGAVGVRGHAPGAGDVDVEGD